MKLLNKALVVIVLILAGALWYYQRQAESNYRQYLNSRAEAGTVTKEAEQVWSRLLTVQKSIETIRTDSTMQDLRIDELLSVIKRKDGEIKALIAFQATFKPDTVTIPGVQDTVYVNSRARQRVTFDTEIKGDTVYGHTLTDPPEAFIGLKRRPVSFAVSLIEKKSGEYETILTTDNPYIDISAVSGEVIPYRNRSFLSRFISGPDLSIGWTQKRGAFAGIGASIWKIRPAFIVTEFGTDYGANISIWRKEW